MAGAGAAAGGAGVRGRDGAGSTAAAPGRRLFYIRGGPVRPLGCGGLGRRAPPSPPPPPQPWADRLLRSERGGAGGGPRSEGESKHHQRSLPRSDQGVKDFRSGQVQTSRCISEDPIGQNKTLRIREGIRNWERTAELMGQGAFGLKQWRLCSDYYERTPPLEKQQRVP